MEHSEQLNDLAAALAKAQAVMKHAVKDADNPFYKSKYADLASVAEACREALASNGLSVVQGTQKGDGPAIHLDTMLLHTSGQWMRSTLTMTPTKQDPQGIGSCITYARRYSLSAICGIATEEDDDGNAASAPAKELKRRAGSGPAPVKAEPRTTVEQHVHKDKIPDFCPDCGAEILPYFSNSTKNPGRQYYQCEAGHEAKQIKGHFWKWAEVWPQDKTSIEAKEAPNAEAVA